MFSIFNYRILIGRFNMGLFFYLIWKIDCGLCDWMCWTGDPLYIVKIVIGPIICFILLLLVSVTGFVMFKKKYAYMTLIFFHRVLNYIHCRVKCVLVSLFFSQTQGPSGHIYASSNPEYLSANDGEEKKRFNHLFCVYSPTD